MITNKTLLELGFTDNIKLPELEHNFELLLSDNNIEGKRRGDEISINVNIDKFDKPFQTNVYLHLYNTREDLKTPNREGGYIFLHCIKTDAQIKNLIKLLTSKTLS